MKNILLSDFLKYFYEEMKHYNHAGGPEDPQFKPEELEKIIEGKVATEIKEFLGKLKFEQKDDGSIVLIGILTDEEKKELEDAETEQEEYSINLSKNRGKNKVTSYFYKIRILKGSYGSIKSFGKSIGTIINPSPSGATKWNKDVGFPLYKDQSNPIDIVKLDIKPLENQHFIRLGTFLEYLEQKIIPKIIESSTEQPMLLIDTHPKNNLCYVIDNSISLDPNITIVNNGNFYTKNHGYEKIYSGLKPFIEKTNGFFYGNIMNIYFSFNRILEIMDDVDNNNQISVFKVLKSISTDINKSLGNINNIEPIIDKESNTIKLIDQTSIPGLKTIASTLGYKDFNTKEETLEIFGYNNTDNTSNFVQKAGITTSISKDYATMITIGATANGSIPGAESTSFSKWNVGIIDRFKNSLIDGEASRGDNLETQNKRVLTNYSNFTNQQFGKLGFSSKKNEKTINSDYVNENQSAASDYYIYAQAQTSNADPKYIESSIGFLPFNLKLTMDGLSGIKIYNKVKVNTSFLPTNYGETLSFIVTGVNHKLSNDEWVTNLDTIATTKDTQQSTKTVKTAKILRVQNNPTPSTLNNITGPVIPDPSEGSDLFSLPT